MSFINLSPTDLVVSNDAVTAPAWTTGNPTLLGINGMNARASTAPEFYTDVYAVTGTVTSSIPQFSVSYGHISGSQATLFNPLVPSASATRTVYNQFRNLVYADENTSFNFGTGSTASPDIFVINVNRQCYKESLFPGTFNLQLSHAGNVVNLTNNSNDVTTISYLDCGRVYTVVTGSNGYRNTAADKTGTSGSYGLFLPDVGLVILNPRALFAPAVSGGIALPVPNPLTLTNIAPTPLVQNLLSNAIQTGSFTLNSYETVSSDYVFVRVPNNQFNYTTNPSVISGSGALIYSTMINNPQTYVTTVGLYNDNQECLAVAKLSKPLVKDFTKESLIQIKLNW
jgi:hypothetical protein